MEQIITIQMTSSEFRKMIKENVREALKEEFDPIKDQFNNRNLSDKEARLELNVSRSTLYSLRKSGELPFTKIGEKVLYRHSDILALKNKRELQ